MFSGFERGAGGIREGSLAAAGKTREDLQVSLSWFSSLFLIMIIDPLFFLLFLGIV